MNWTEKLKDEEWFIEMETHFKGEMLTINYVAGYAAFTNNVVVLRMLIDEGATQSFDLFGCCFDFEAQRCLVDAGYNTHGHGSVKLLQFIDSRNSARLAAILTMRAIRRSGLFYRDPARMVGRAIWAQRAYYLEESEKSERVLKK